MLGPSSVTVYGWLLGPMVGPEGPAIFRIMCSGDNLRNSRVLLFRTFCLNLRHILRMLGRRNRGFPAYCISGSWAWICGISDVIKISDAGQSKQYGAGPQGSKNQSRWSSNTAEIPDIRCERLWTSWQRKFAITGIPEYNTSVEAMLDDWKMTVVKREILRPEFQKIRNERIGIHPLGIEPQYWPAIINSVTVRFKYSGDPDYVAWKVVDFLT